MSLDPVKRCSKCRCEKPFTEFYRNRALKDGYQNQCKPCNDASRRAWIETNPEKHREGAAVRNRKWRYGLTREDHEAMLKVQDNVCAACGGPQVDKDAAGRTKPLDIDHDHSCQCDEGRSAQTRNFRLCGLCVRGLLCGPCNRAIGNVKDSVWRLERLIDYLRRCGATT